MDRISGEGKGIGDEYIWGMEIEGGVMGGEGECGFVKDVLEWYVDKELWKELWGEMLGGLIYGEVGEKYGLLYLEKEEDVKDNMDMLGWEIFGGKKEEVRGG